MAAQSFEKCEVLIEGIDDLKAAFESNQTELFVKQCLDDYIIIVTHLKDKTMEYPLKSDVESCDEQIWDEQIWNDLHINEGFRQQSIDEIQKDQQSKAEVINEYSIDSDWISLILSRKFCSRILTILILLFLCMLALCYSFAQIYKLELDDYWCGEPKSLDDIREHSIEIGENGTEDGCWMAKNFVVKYFYS